MTSQPVEQRGDFKEWNYTETHLPVRRIDEHNACVTALREALADAARLREALRKFTVEKDFGCSLCDALWDAGQPESHAPGCLAKLDHTHE